MVDPPTAQGGEDSQINVFQAQNDKADDNGHDNYDLRSEPPPEPKLCPDGKCSRCAAEDASDDSVSCLFCGLLFHMLCFNVTKELPSKRTYFKDNACTKTFYTEYKKIIDAKKRRVGNFLFVCDSCLTDQEQRNASDVKCHVQTLERKVDVMEASLREIKDLLVSKQAESVTPIPVSNPGVQAVSSSPWFDEKAMEAVKSAKSKAALVINKDEAGMSQTDLEKMVLDHKIPVETSYENKAGNKVVILSSVADRDKLNSQISVSFPSQQTKTPPVRLPTISIANIKSEMTSSELKDIVLALNPAISNLHSKGSTFDVISVRPQRNGNKFYGTVRVSSDVRDVIELNLDNKLYVGMMRCDVYDHFYIKRCNKCQGFYHYKDQCKATSPTCAKCGKNHQTSQCSEKDKDNFIPSCANCKKFGCANGHTHEASSRECYSYIAAQDALKKSILGSKNLLNKTMTR